MPIKAILTDLASGRTLYTDDGFAQWPVLITARHKELYGSFKSVTLSAAGTSTIVAPIGNNGIVLTDLVMTTDKVSGGVVTVQWTDDIRTIEIVTAHVQDVPCNLAMPFQGNWAGWQGARLEVVVTNAVSTTVSCGYFKISEDVALPYSTWDARR